MSEKTLNLYRVELNGLGTHYVVAPHPTLAYEMIRNKFDAEDYGFRNQRGLQSIQLIAEATQYPECKVRLWL